MYDKSFIEVQFPISKVSKESYKERKAGSGQTLTGFGKWWGRKPLILVRAAILGILMPATDNPKKDRDIFLKILTMDDVGLLKRKNKSLNIDVIYQNIPNDVRKRYFNNDSKDKPEYIKDITNEQKKYLQELAFKRLSYDEKLKYCIRPEEVDDLEKSEWDVINDYLGTSAYNLQDLIKELGEKKFGEVPTVGDCFCGGGSIPFEAARMGLNVNASDLNPVAMLLTWASLNISGCDDEEIKKLREFQERVYDEADKIITEWGIEHNESGDRANAYLYCNEAVCPECGYKVPLAPSWIIGKKTKTVAILKENQNKAFGIEIKSNATKEEMENAEKSATIKNGDMVCPHCNMSTPITVLRRDRKNDDGSMEYGLRKWEKDEFIPRDSDVFHERLYCIRYEREYTDDMGNKKMERYYTAPSEMDLKREEKANVLLNERFARWQKEGYIPDGIIEEGDKTNEPIRTRGWKYWHQLFNPRQLLINGLLMEIIDKEAKTGKEKVVGLLGVNKCCDWNSKLCRWHVDDTHVNAQTFYNQAFNTLFNYCVRSYIPLKDIWYISYKNEFIKTIWFIKASDARQVHYKSHIWITDPPYADAVNYHELSEFFLAWDKKMLKDIFPDWYTDSKRVLAVKGRDEAFKESMVEIYKNLAKHMPDNGMQIVMFTHQDVSVWADLALIMWAAGLKVTAAWNIATETDASGLKNGNYVKGTVLLVLRKQKADTTAFLDEIYPEIETEVKNQIDSMRDIDDKDDPNFGDPDYLLAAYAASLKVLTSYKNIEDIDISYELSKERANGEESPIERLIQEAVKIAYDYLIPKGFDGFIWKTLLPEERFYIKGLDIERDGIYQLSAYQELARGFGIREYKDLLASTKANNARLKTALEFAMRGMNESSNFGKSLLRNILASLYLSIKDEDTSKGKTWLKSELPNYWSQRNAIISILDYISTLEHIDNMNWDQESKYARLLKELISNDGV